MSRASNEKLRTGDYDFLQKMFFSAMSTVIQRDEAHRLIDSLPTSATWDDLIHQIFVRDAVERDLLPSAPAKGTPRYKNRGVLFFSESAAPSRFS